MATLLLPEDVEQAFIDELSSHYAIGTSVPEDKPAVFLRVNAAGGFQRDLVTDTFTVTLEAFASTETTASYVLSWSIAKVQDSIERLGTLGGRPAYRLQVPGLPQNLPLTTMPSHKRYTSTLAPDLRRKSVTL